MERVNVEDVWDFLKALKNNCNLANKEALLGFGADPLLI